MKVVPLKLALFFNSSFMFSQDSYPELYNKLFFNLFTDTPTKEVLNFINEYLEDVVITSKEPSKWNISNSVENKINIVSHSLYFEKHPYFDYNLKKGQLVFIVNVDRVKNLNNIEIILEFSSLSDAENMFNNLQNQFKSVSIEHYYYSDSIRSNAIYYSEHLYGIVPSGIIIFLIKEKLGKSSYQVMITVN